MNGIWYTYKYFLQFHSNVKRYTAEFYHLKVDYLSDHEN